MMLGYRDEDMARDLNGNCRDMTVP
ncbi:MAG: hypothetical protein H6R00_2455, partial [Proteobacteria bacterium]|nr:hypothetical protein [Pseudomonadota bacterium]